MLSLLECELKNFELGSNNHVKLEFIFNNGSRENLVACNIDIANLDVVNSCNGLLCLCDPFSNGFPLVVCNPVIGEFIRLPNATMTSTRLSTKRVINQEHVGFGYQPKTNDYKVIKIWTRHVRGDNNFVFERAILEIHTGNTIMEKC